MWDNQELSLKNIKISQKLEVDICGTQKNIIVEIELTEIEIKVTLIIQSQAIINQKINSQNDVHSQKYIRRNR